MADADELRAKYGASEHGKFCVVDKIGVPHPYCITPRHIKVASNDHGGILSEAAIEDAEEKGACCGICRGQLRYKEHEQALLVGCRAELKDAEGKTNPELHAYLLRIKKSAREKYAGFAFKRV